VKNIRSGREHKNAHSLFKSEQGIFDSNYALYGNPRATVYAVEPQSAKALTRKDA
jgi:hypothetical protein